MAYNFDDLSDDELDRRIAEKEARLSQNPPSPLAPQKPQKTNFIPAGASRVDRHNNPIAVMYAPSFSKILDKQGIPYDKGDPFPEAEGGSAHSTIRFPDPYSGRQASKAILGESQPALNWYLKSSGKKAASLYPHVRTPQDFASLPYEDKERFIDLIAEGEGTSGAVLSKNVQTPFNNMSDQDLDARIAALEQKANPQTAKSIQPPVPIDEQEDIARREAMQPHATWGERGRAALSGYARALPGSDWASAIVPTLWAMNKRGIQGNPMMFDEALQSLMARKQGFTQRREQEEAKSPFSAVVGELPADLALGALTGPIFGKIPGLAASQGTGVANFIGNVLRSGAREGLQQAALGQLQHGLDPERAKMDLMLGAGFGSGGEVLGQGLQKGYGLVKRGIESNVIPSSVRKAFESIPFVGGALKGSREAAETLESRAFNEAEALRKAEWDRSKQMAIKDYEKSEAAKKLSYQQEKISALENMRQLTPGEKIQTGESLINAVKEGRLNLGKEYRKSIDPVFKKYGKELGDAGALDKEIKNILSESDLLDDTGKVIREEINGIIAPERKAFLSKIADISDSLNKNTSIKKLNQLTQDLQSLANFGSTARTSEEKLFGNLANKAKEAMQNSLEKVAQGTEGKILKAAKSQYAQNMPLYEHLGKMADKFPEQIVNAASTHLPESFIKDVLKNQPQLKDSVADVVLSNIVHRGTTPKTLSKVIDGYGRNTLKDLLGEKTFKSLTEAEGRFVSANKGFLRGEKPLIEPFIPKQKPEKELAKVYKILKEFVSNRKPGELTRKGARVASPFANMER